LFYEFEVGERQAKEKTLEMGKEKWTGNERPKSVKESWKDLALVEWPEKTMMKK